MFKSKKVKPINSTSPAYGVFLVDNMHYYYVLVVMVESRSRVHQQYTTKTEGDIDIIFLNCFC
jgi:hypothetical protein